MTGKGTCHTICFSNTHYISTILSACQCFRPWYEYFVSSVFSECHPASLYTEHRVYYTLAAG